MTPFGRAAGMYYRRIRWSLGLPGGNMSVRRVLFSTVAALSIAAGSAAAQVPAAAQQAALAIDNDDIGGVVTGPTGPEAGVWVIAETTDLPTKYAKIVVT